jgi:hypothetical protein
MCLHHVPVDLDERRSVLVDGRLTIAMWQFGPAQLSVRKLVLISLVIELVLEVKHSFFVGTGP